MCDLSNEYITNCMHQTLNRDLKHQCALSFADFQDISVKFRHQVVNLAYVALLPDILSTPSMWIMPQSRCPPVLLYTHPIFFPERELTREFGERALLVHILLRSVSFLSGWKPPSHWSPGIFRQLKSKKRQIDTRKNNGFISGVYNIQRIWLSFKINKL